MGPYGSVWAHIKTGKSPMAHDHFQTPPDPKKGYNNPIWVLFWDVCDRKCLHDSECNTKWTTFPTARPHPEHACTAKEQYYTVMAVLVLAKGPIS